MLVLSVMALALTMVTRTEMEIGANERAASRAFYAADAGIEVAVAKALVTNDYAESEFTYKDTSGVLSALELGSEVELSAFYPILDLPCNLCEINNSGSYQERAFRKVNHAVTSTALRYAAAAGSTDRRPVASKELSAMVQVEPWRVPPEAYLPLNDADALQKIKF